MALVYGTIFTWRTWDRAAAGPFARLRTDPSTRVEGAPKQAASGNLQGHVQASQTSF